MDPYQYYKRDFSGGGGGGVRTPKLPLSGSAHVCRNQFGPRFEIWQNIGHNLDPNCFDTLKTIM